MSRLGANRELSLAAPNPAWPSFLGPTTEAQLARVAIELGALDVGGPLTFQERHLFEAAAHAPPVTDEALEEIRQAVAAKQDPLGSALSQVRPAAHRRKLGAFYTPPELLLPMVTWVLQNNPDRLVDAGCGSGRFSVEVAVRDQRSLIVAVDIDPLATFLTRAAMATLGRHHVRVIQADYTMMRLPPIAGTTGFLGNPPYVRHHDLSAAAKAWARSAAKQCGCSFSSLAGLHAHFYLATALHARPGDVGCFVTSSEWLDVSYGAIIRELLLGRLGGQSIHVLDPTAVPFADAMTTAAIACFQVGSTPPELWLSASPTIAEVMDLSGGTPFPRPVLAGTSRWSPLLRSAGDPPPEGLIALKEIASVHRGVVTGANDYFVLTRSRAQELGIRRWCRPAITKAQEILTANGLLSDGPETRLLLDIPGDVDRSAHPELDAYLRLGEQPMGTRPPVCAGYICRHRRPWWRLGTPPPPPIVVSYMARQAPAFALNPDGLVPINIAHGLYPRRPFDDAQLRALVRTLNGVRESFQGSGRTYHGGMEKFEPRELEALLVPAVSAYS